MNELEILDKLNAKDFRSISKNQIIQFANNLSDFPEEIQKRIIDQFPKFSDLAEAVSTRYYEIVKEYIKDNELIHLQTASHQKVLDTYKERIDALGPNMSNEDFMAIMLDMKEEADKIADIIERHQIRRERVVHAAEVMGAAAIAIPATAVGIVRFIIKR